VISDFCIVLNIESFLVTGQLGHGNKRPQVLPKQVTLGGMEDECVSSVTCGGRHTIAVTEDGECFSWGLGHFGCLGRSFTPFEYDADAAVVAFTGAAPLAAEGVLDGTEVDAPRDGLQPPALLHPHPPVVPQPAAAVAGAAEIRGVERDFAAELAAHLDLIANLSLDDSSDQCIPKQIDSLERVRIIGASAGHRHSLFLDELGSIYSCGAGSNGCLGHGDTVSLSHPVKIMAFEEEKVRVMQMSAGVDMSMAVSTTGEVWSWGKTDGGRVGLGLAGNDVMLPRRVPLRTSDGDPVKAVDVECGYVHSLIVGLDGTLHVCGGVGVDGEDDGQSQEGDGDSPSSLPETSIDGRPHQVADFNIWHRVPEPKDEVKKHDRWKKFGKYEVKGRSKMLSDP